MTKIFDVYAGVGGAVYRGTIEAKDEKEALQYAYQIAEQEYQSQEENKSWEDCEEELRHLDLLEDLTQNEQEDLIDKYYLKAIETSVEYYVIESGR
jgi:hypothetical protein